MSTRYDEVLQLAALFDDSGEQMRQRARLGPEIIADPAVAETAPLSPITYARATDDIRAATTGTSGLLARSIELDADALVLRATVLTYRWIDELQSAAYQTLGSIAGRAIGYLAPEVALGGAIVSAGLIETDPLDRDGVTAYLHELAASNPELMDHVSRGGGGLLDGLRMRSLLTVGVLSDDDGRSAGRGGLRAIGVEPFSTDFSAALRDVAGELVEQPPTPTSHVDAAVPDRATAVPRNLTDLLTALHEAPASVVVRKVAPHRYIAYLPGLHDSESRRLRLVGGDRSSYAEHVERTIETAVADDAEARVMLVGSAQGGLTAAEVAAAAPTTAFVVDQVVTAGSPSAHVPRLPPATRMLSLEDRADPVALLGSLLSSSAPNRVTVVYDGGELGLVEGGRAADAAGHPVLVDEIARITELGYLTR